MDPVRLGKNGGGKRTSLKLPLSPDSVPGHGVLWVSTTFLGTVASLGCSPLFPSLVWLYLCGGALVIVEGGGGGGGGGPVSLVKHG